MSSKVPFPPPGFDELSRQDQVDYVQALWESIAPPLKDTDEIPDWHKEILDERMARYSSEGIEGTSLEEFEEELLELFTKR
jgi:putative addiction module component (TIGR02574 family)